MSQQKANIMLIKEAELRAAGAANGFLGKNFQLNGLVHDVACWEKDFTSVHYLLRF